MHARPTLPVLAKQESLPFIYTCRRNPGFPVRENESVELLDTQRVRVMDMFVDHAGHGLIVICTKLKLQALSDANRLLLLSYQWNITMVSADTASSATPSGSLTMPCQPLPYQFNGHTIVLNCSGTGIVAADNNRVHLEGTSTNRSRLSYDNLHVCRPPLAGCSFSVVAVVQVEGFTLEHPLDAIGHFVDHHAALGIQHFLIYIDDAASTNTTFLDHVTRKYRARFAGIVTFIPFWHGRHSPTDFVSQPMQNTHALYSLRGISDWYLSCDVDEYVFAAGGGQSAYLGTNFL
jgi:hypothetical protein